MSRRPFSWPAGQTRSLRGDLFARLNLAACVGGQIGVVSDQYAALSRGQAVTFTTEQLRSFYPLGTEHPSLPANLDAAAAWTLAGDDDLSPVT
jgi:hypothetical protein